MTGVLPETMTALRVHARGEEPRAERVPVPRPGADNVLVAMAASAIGHHDLGVIAGTLPGPPPPFTPGLEGAGRVVAVGEGVDPERLPPGAPVRVVAGGLPDGTWSEVVVAPARSVRPLPEGLDLGLAAACGTVATSAWAALFDVGDVQEGEAVGVTGASGAVGSLVLQLAARHGVARRAAWTRTPDRLPPGTEVEPAEPVDLLVDTVGGAGLAARLRAVRPGGRAVLVGYTAGTRIELELPALLAGDVSLLPLNMMRRRLPREVEPRLLDAFAAGELTLELERVRPSELADALARLREGRARGRVVLVWDELVPPEKDE